MSERIIHTADLSRIQSALSNIGEAVVTVSQQVNAVDAVVSTTRNDLADLQRLFRDFELRYERMSEVALAETRLIKVRQELEHNYGHHAEIRRTATGILQASDIGIVRQQTVNNVTEEFMLLAPGYWLAPALVALSSWLQDNQTVAERALAEALRRDDEKTSLFFALVCRRAERSTAFAVWLDRYLGQQNPFQLKRQTIVLIDAVAAGAFSADAQFRCQQRFQTWLDTLAEQAGFLEDQRQQWRDALEFRISSDSRTEAYAHLAKYSPSWTQLENSLNRTALNADLLVYLKGIMDSPQPPTARLIDAVDAQLERLVTDHDTLERPLRREEALLELIVREGGRKDIAQSKFDLEHVALDEAVSFTQMLTNAGMHAEKSGATRASQRLALALSRDWLRDAYADATLATRQAVPASIDLSIDGWSGVTNDGSDEPAQIASVESYLTTQMDEALALVKLQPKHWVIGAIGALLVCTAVAGQFWLALIGLLILVWVFFEYKGLEKKRQAIRDASERRRSALVATLQGCLSEVVEWRRDFAACDIKSEATAAYIEGIAADSYIAMPKDGNRRLVLDPA